MKNDKPNGPRPGVALATVAAALTVAMGITIGALASYSSPKDASNDESVRAVEAGPPPDSPVVEEPVAMETQASPAAREDEVRGSRRHDEHEREHERRERDPEEDDDDDD